jgi:hypothetical protein
MTTAHLDEKMLAELERLHSAVTALDLSTAEERREGPIDCPVCGDGTVESTDYCNIDQRPIGIMVYGIGEEMRAAEQWIAAMRNAAPALIAAAREAERLRRAALREDGMPYDAWCAQLQAEVAAAEARIKVLEEALLRLTLAAKNVCAKWEGKYAGEATGLALLGELYAAAEAAALSPPQPAQDTAQTAAQDVDGMGPNGPVLADHTPTSGWLRVELDAATNEVAGWGEGTRRGIPVAAAQDKPAETVCPHCSKALVPYGDDPYHDWWCDHCKLGFFNDLGKATFGTGREDTSHG